jgi:hypothetical protein
MKNTINTKVTSKKVMITEKQVRNLIENLKRDLLNNYNK